MDSFHDFEGRVPARLLARARLTEAELDARVRRHEVAHRELLWAALIALMLAAAFASPLGGALKPAGLLVVVSGAAALFASFAPPAAEAPLAQHPLLTHYALQNARTCQAAAAWRDAALKERRALRRFDAFAMRELACLSQQPPFNPALAELHTPTHRPGADA